MTVDTLLPAGTFDPLRSVLAGELILPGDAGYDAARAVWNAMIDAHPAAIARCASTADVVAAVNFGRDHELEIAVRGGGHSAAGLATCEGGLVIDLGPMHAVEVDPETRVAVAGGGTTWAQFDAATTAHNLASTGGAISTTGIAGLTLGGGIGWLGRKYGLACDNLIGAEVVLADGSVVTTSETERPELLWGLRGGGGNFGIVTSFTFRLHPMDGVVGGPIFYPREIAADALRTYRELTASATDDQTTNFGLLSSPEGDPLTGFIAVSASADPAVAAPMHEKILELGPPLADMVGPMPYVALQSMLDPAFAVGIPVYWKAHFLNELDDAVMELIVDWGTRMNSPLSLVLIEHLGGAVARVSADATAFAHRRATYNLAILGRWLDPADADAAIAWVRGFHDALRPYAAGVYTNYLGVGDGRERVREAYDEAAYDRLVALKREYDPENLFHRNQNIRPD
jgi:FAD/FMN-containing dehydrogenase